jgi:hypothetical protein
MNIPDPELPNELPKRPKAARSFEDILKELRPQLQALPAEQRIPVLPPDRMMLEGVEEFVRANKMVVADSCPSTIALAGEFLDRATLREGRVGLHGNVRVLSFLYRYSDKSMRAVVLFPRDGVDTRLLGMAVCWGLVADVPESVAQSKICEVRDFFAINAFNLANIVDIPALERYQADCRKRMAEEQEALQRRADDLEQERSDLRGVCKQLGEEVGAQQRQAVAQHNRAEGCKRYTGDPLDGSMM